MEIQIKVFSQLIEVEFSATDEASSIGNGDTRRNSSFVDIRGVPCSDLGDLKKIRGSKIFSSSRHLRNASIYNPPNYSGTIMVAKHRSNQYHSIYIKKEKHFILRC